ncbi:hypothetical protein C8J57DRAFT_1218881 [Mycena rebaudengoi]|nr:hypothetical protein C8J57DRAFT_1218881 [Mycena rebaudengoi]
MSHPSQFPFAFLPNFRRPPQYPRPSPHCVNPLEGGCAVSGFKVHATPYQWRLYRWLPPPAESRHLGPEAAAAPFAVPPSLTDLTLPAGPRCRIFHATLLVGAQRRITTDDVSHRHSAYRTMPCTYYRKPTGNTRGACVSGPSTAEVIKPITPNTHDCLIPHSGGLRRVLELTPGVVELEIFSQFNGAHSSDELLQVLAEVRVAPRLRRLILRGDWNRDSIMRMLRSRIAILKTLHLPALRLLNEDIEELHAHGIQEGIVDPLATEFRKTAAGSSSSIVESKSKPEEARNKRLKGFAVALRPKGTTISSPFKTIHENASTKGKWGNLVVVVSSASFTSVDEFGQTVMGWIRFPNSASAQGGQPAHMSTHPELPQGPRLATNAWHVSAGRLYSRYGSGDYCEREYMLRIRSLVVERAWRMPADGREKEHRGGSIDIRAFPETLYMGELRRSQFSRRSRGTTQRNAERLHFEKEPLGRRLCRGRFDTECFPGYFWQRFEGDQ